MPKPKPFPKHADPVFAELKCHPVGVYAHRPAHEYHADEAYSFSTGRNLIVGPTYCWSQRSWNPLRDDTSTAAQEEGNVYHTRILEGPAVFAKRYAVAPNKRDYPEAIDGQAALKAECGKLGLKVSGTIPELVQRLKESGEFQGEFWVDVLAKWEGENMGKVKVKPELVAAVELAARICEQHPDIGEVWKVGRPEVSIHYISRQGVPSRCRLDWLRPGEVLDVKTMANQMRNPMNVQAARTIVSEYYHVQAFNYVEAVEAALQMPDELWHGFTPEEVAAYKAAARYDFRWLFIGKSAPDIVQRQFGEEVAIDYATWPDGREVEGGPPREPSTLWRSAANIHDNLQARFKFFWSQYGREPWFDAAPVIGLRDSSPGLSSFSLTLETQMEV